MTDEDQLRSSELGRSLRAIGALADEVEPAAAAARRPRPTFRRGRLVAVVAALAGCTATATAATLLSGDEVNQFARDAQISRSDAERSLANQSRLPALDARLRDDLPGVFAGLWVDTDGVTPIIGIAADRAPRLEQITAAAIADAQLTNAPRIRWKLRSSAVALERGQARIQRLLDATANTGSGRVEVEPDIVRNRLILHVPIEPTSGQRRVVRLVRNLTTVDLDVQRGTPRATFLDRRPGAQVTQSTPTARSR